MAFRRRTAREDEARAREALERAVTVLRSFQRAGAAEVPVADVLEMLGAGPETVPVQQVPPADPMTGAKWAGPPGSAPPGNP